MHVIGEESSESLQQKISGMQKGPAERDHVKKRQKSSKSVKKFFDTFRAGQKTSKIAEKCQKHFRHFSTIVAQHHFSEAPFGGLYSKKRNLPWVHLLEDEVLRAQRWKTFKISLQDLSRPLSRDTRQDCEAAGLPEAPNPRKIKVGGK